MTARDKKDLARRELEIYTRLIHAGAVYAGVVAGDKRSIEEGIRLAPEFTSSADREAAWSILNSLCELEGQETIPGYSELLESAWQRSFNIAWLRSTDVTESNN